MNRGYARCIIGLLFLPLLTGCAFDRRWRDMKREAITTAQPQSADPLAGRWEGRWASDVNGHSGGLRAIITSAAQTTASDRMYKADFDATFFGLLRAGYSISLTAQPGDTRTVEFSGSKDLGGLGGGMYEYRGVADGETFEAKYESKSDHGTFHMTRPKE